MGKGAVLTNHIIACYRCIRPPRIHLTICLRTGLLGLLIFNIENDLPVSFLAVLILFFFSIYFYFYFWLWLTRAQLTRVLEGAHIFLSDARATNSLIIQWHWQSRARFCFFFSSHDLDISDSNSEAACSFATRNLHCVPAIHDHSNIILNYACASWSV